MEDIKNLVDFNKRNESEKPNVEVLGTLVRINGKLYLEKETVYEDGSKGISSHAVKDIVLGY